MKNMDQLVLLLLSTASLFLIASAAPVDMRQRAEELKNQKWDMLRWRRR